MEYKVLLIDDNIDNQMLMNFILKKENILVDIANDGQEGILKLLSNSNSLPHLIIVDHNMPIMDGPEFLLEIEKTMPEILANIPIIMMTAYEGSQISPNKATEIFHKNGNLDDIIKLLCKYRPKPK